MKGFLDEGVADAKCMTASSFNFLVPSLVGRHLLYLDLAVRTTLVFLLVFVGTIVIIIPHHH